MAEKGGRSGDDDSKFTFLWIAFNSAYAQDFEQKANYGERGLYQEFLSRLVELDSDNLLAEIVWKNYSGAIRAALDNEFILESYWNYHAGRISKEEWKDTRSKAKMAANTALGHKILRQCFLLCSHASIRSVIRSFTVVRLTVALLIGSSLEIVPYS